MNQPLSPSTQIMIAVTHIYQKHGGDPPARAVAAAAIHAAADQVAPEAELFINARGTRFWHKAIRQAEIRAELLAIAAELYGTNPTNQEDYEA